MSDVPRSTGFATLAIHAGADRDRAVPARTTPFDETASSFVFDEADHAAVLFGLRDFGGVDSRNKTIAVLEERIAALEGGTAALAVGSGHAAQFIVLQTLLRPGDELIASRRLCGESTNQFDALKSFGWQVKWADPEHPESFVEALSGRTRAIFIESIATPGGFITDIAPIATVARQGRVPLVVDNTLATPYLIRPFEHGADIIIHSATKFLGGPGTSIGGLIVDGGTFDWLGDERFPLMSQPCPRYGNRVLGDTFGNFAFAVACRILGLCDLGAALSPFHAFLILSGIETLPLRMQRHCGNASAVADHLVRHPAVNWVDYAGLPSDPGYSRAQHYAPRGAGGVFTFGVAGGYDAGVRLVKKLKLFSHLGTVGDTRSLVIHPASATHRQIADGERVAAEGDHDVVRLSIGLEDKEDLIADLDQALAV